MSAVFCGKKKAPLSRALLMGAAALLFVFCFCLQTAFAGAKKSEKAKKEGPVVIRAVHGDFDAVWDALNMALTNRGYVVSGVSHVQKMLDRTGHALGRTKKIFARAKVLEFCSAVVSRDMMEQNPHFIAFCPYRIVVYTLPGGGEKNKKTVYISYTRPVWNDNSGQKALEEVDKMLEGIVNDVAGQE